MPTTLPIRTSYVYERPTRALAALTIWALALLAFTLPTAAAHHDGDIAYVEAQP